jgi:hypothetical protein
LAFKESLPGIRSSMVQAPTVIMVDPNAPPERRPACG